MSAPAGSSASKKRLSSGVALSPHGGGVVSECLCVCVRVCPPDAVWHDDDDGVIGR